MTLENFVNKTNWNGKIISKIPRKNFNKLIKKYKYIDVIEFWYDFENSEDITWIDIEGIGYGWLWLEYPHSRIQQRKTIIKFAKDIYADAIEKVFVAETEGVREFVFKSRTMTERSRIVRIRLSNNKELRYIQ